MKVLSGRGNAANAIPRRGLWMHSLHYLNVWHYSLAQLSNPLPSTSVAIASSSSWLPPLPSTIAKQQRVVYSLLFYRYASRLFVSSTMFTFHGNARQLPPPATLSSTKFLKLRAVSPLCTDPYYLRAATSSLANCPINPSSSLCLRYPPPLQLYLIFKKVSNRVTRASMM